MRGGPLGLLAVGRMRPGVEADLFAHYNRRIRPPMVVSEIADKGGPRQEAAALLAAWPAAAAVVALHPKGSSLDSEGFAAALQRWGKCHFLIGGADGLDATVLARADFALSLGPMTWPHLLVRGMLAEQVFRAQSIRDGHPYHRK